MKIQVQSSQLKLNKILVGLALVLGFGVTNQSFAYEYFTSTNGCKVRQYSGEKLSKIDYTGSCQNGYANGQGNYTKYDSNNKITLTYKGQMKDGMPHGQGTIEWADGGKYDGEWKDGERHGLGKLTLVKESSGIASWQRNNKGEWQGNTYVVQGRFYNDNLDQKND